MVAELKIGKAVFDEVMAVIPFMRARRRRSYLEFVEEEIWIPTGPAKGRFKRTTQPVFELLLREYDNPRWQRFVIVGCGQSGKTTIGYIIPTLYALFELEETCINGVTEIQMAKEKWNQVLFPILKRTRYADLMPTRGAGSKGGDFELIQFLNGPSLKFMSGSGDDKNRAHFTARIVIVTETDGMGEAKASSVEADPIKQMEARSNAFGSNRRIFLECTPSTPAGKIWREYQASSKGRIVVQCDACKKWSTPEREDLHGWKEAKTEVEAQQQSHYACPQCGVVWTERDRRSMNERAKLLHSGQEIDEAGVVTGDLPETFTCGFRWNAFNNMFVTAGDVGVKEWRALRDDDPDNAEKELCQFDWAIPYEGEVETLADLKVASIIARMKKPREGVVPESSKFLTAGLDLGKWRCHFAVPSFDEDGSPHIVEWGEVEVPSKRMAVEKALEIALEEFHEMCERGWRREKSGDMVRPDAVFIDSGNWTEVVYGFCRKHAGRYWPVKGFGMSTYTGGRYAAPKKRTDAIYKVGDGWHVARVPAKKIRLVEFDADLWKTKTHERLTTPLGEPGALTLYQADREEEHLQFAKHMVAENRVEVFERGNKGTAVRWEHRGRANHLLDGTSMALCAGDFVGVRIRKKDENPDRVSRGGAGGAEKRVDGGWFSRQRRN